MMVSIVLKCEYKELRLSDGKYEQKNRSNSLSSRPTMLPCRCLTELHIRIFLSFRASSHRLLVNWVPWSDNILFGCPTPAINSSSFWMDISFVVFLTGYILAYFVKVSIITSVCKYLLVVKVSDPKKSMKISSNRLDF